MPRAKVTGAFWLRGHRHEFEQALGYHDHEYWKVSPTAKLFADDAVSGWYWGRFFGQDHTIVFADIHLRGQRLRPIIVAGRNSIAYWSNNRIEVQPHDFRRDSELAALYPKRITVYSTDRGLPVRMTLSLRDITESWDLLHGVNPLLRWLIRHFVCKPVYIGLLARATANLDHKQVEGTALCEMIRFRARGSVHNSSPNFRLGRTVGGATNGESKTKMKSVNARKERRKP
jgi:hypothetical protein